MTPERFNEWRVIPRILTLGFYGFYIQAFYYVVDWFTTYPWETVENEAVALALAGFPAAIMGVLAVVLARVTDLYLGSSGGPKQ